ncbi:MAG: hypothetical protein Phog2KO_44190 [Phototrophicaceae bacterium]
MHMSNSELRVHVNSVTVKSRIRMIFSELVNSYLSSLSNVVKEGLPTTTVTGRDDCLIRIEVKFWVCNSDLRVHVDLVGDNLRIGMIYFEVV